MGSSARWPASLTLVRHGESAGNVARDAAEARGDPVIDIALRDMDVPLSARGEAQAEALGEWLAKSDRPAPCAVLTSPYPRPEPRGSSQNDRRAGKLCVCQRLSRRMSPTMWPSRGGWRTSRR
jgi:probable phosphoglycerate mutase